MKMASARLKMLTLKVHITVSVMTDVDADETRMQGIGFIRLVIVFLAMQ